MQDKSREFQIFVKPVGASCNLNCSYCYYLGKRIIYPGTGQLIMPDEILERYVKQHIEASTEELVNFSWHGGEPMLAGIEFYRKATAFQRKYIRPGETIINGMQTNGTLLNEEWCRFLSEENFIVGISIDGPGDLHNKLRYDRKKRPVFEKVLGGYRMLQQHGIPTEILCVVNSLNVKYPLAVYDFFKELGARFITFLPLVEKRQGSVKGVSRFTVPSLDFGIFLSKVFDEWVEKDIGKIKIQIIEEALRPAFGQEHTLCIFRENCGGVPVVEHNGDFYPCDHFVDPGHLAGNIKEDTLSDLLDSGNQRKFGQEKSLLLPAFCRGCEVKVMCNGECPRNRFITAPDGEYGLNYLCKGYKHFFKHIRPFAEAVGSVWHYQ